MPALIGMMVGGILAVYLLSKLVEWLVVKRVMDDPVNGVIVSVIAAYILAVVIYGFGSADGGSWSFKGVIPYLPGAIIVGILRTRSRIKVVQAHEEQGNP